MFFEFFDFFTRVTSLLCHVSKLNLVPIFVFSSNLVLFFFKNEIILSLLKLTLNLHFYKSYGDILTKINVFIKYFYKYFKLILNSIQNIRLWFCFELEIYFLNLCVTSYLIFNLH